MYQLFRKCNIYKEKRTPTKEVFQMFFLLTFTAKSKSSFLHKQKNMFRKEKDIICCFLYKTSDSWRKLLFVMSTKVVTEDLLPPISLKSYTLVVNGSPYERPRSFKFEGLSRFCYHSLGRLSRDFWMLTLGLTEGTNSILFSFSPLSSHQKEIRLCTIDASIDERSTKARLRNESQEKAPEMLRNPLDGSVRHYPSVSAIIFDSWFSFPILIRQCAARGLSVTCLLKNTSKIYYSFGGKPFSLPSLFHRIQKRLYRNIIGSAVMSLSLNGNFLSARIVFVRSEKQKSKWFEFLSTDLTLSEEIITLYGKCWYIEAFLKMVKAFLKQAREFQLRSYETPVTHASIVFIRYIMLIVVTQKNTDPRTFGELFYACCEEIQDTTFIDTLTLLFKLLKSTKKIDSCPFRRKSQRAICLFCE